MNKIYNNTSISNNLDSHTVFDFWSSFLTADSLTVGVLLDNIPVIDPTSFAELLEFVSVNEVLESFPPLKSAVGLEGTSAVRPRKLPVRVLAKIYTLRFRLCWVPHYFLDSRTIFLPKVADTTSPANISPISISSLLLRKFHRILYKRLVKAIPFSP